VTSVHNHLEVVLPPGDYRDDAMLNPAAYNALAAGAAVPEGRGDRQERQPHADRRGEVPSRRAAAESAVGGLTGVRNIKNEIGFVFDVDPADVNPLVKDALDQHAGRADDSQW
jgi:hypothetical protein